MNNDIQEDYCSFEVSKLLKEKGFDISTSYRGYSLDGTYYQYVGPYEPYKLIKGKIGKMLNSDVIPRDKLIYVPTHALAIKWIRENFGIHISSEYNYGTKLWEYTITFVEDSQKTYELIDKLAVLEPEFKIPEEATEAALTYTLENLV